MYKQIWEKRKKLNREIEILNNSKYENNIEEINERIKKLKKQYDYYNKLLKAMSKGESNE